MNHSSVQMYPVPPSSLTTLPTLYPQQSYSSTPLFLTFPQPQLPSMLSDQPLYPPGVDPYGNSALYAGYETQTKDSQDPNGVSQNWIVTQTEPISYGAVIQSSHETSVASTSLHATWKDNTTQYFTNDTTVLSPNQTRVTKSMRCEVCKIDCNSKDAFEKHISGKKHKKNLQSETNPTSKELESKKRKDTSSGAVVDSVRFCTICNIVCTSQDVFSKHLAGKKHAAKVGLTSHNMIGPHRAAFQRYGIGYIPKRVKIVQSVWCEVCKLSCNSKDVYITHLTGKKHLKNQEKLSISENDAGDSNNAANALQHTRTPIIGPQEKPDADKQEGMDSQKSQKAVTSDAQEKDLETKKLKLVESGAAANAVRWCNLCNVVCNNETVLNFHLAGKKHATMVKKQAESIRVTTA
ncbi:hypothetical protein L6164_014523 [Bauhinia variegata]|uniref:Uncharacterized protein n=1 Tax=Bauhinia variegata TaxID=167791 RepID=A0ACB9NIT4_BAUVA|nr:hypothetical protein L6164_014523 [Bauhinia variegata]